MNYLELYKKLKKGDYQSQLKYGGRSNTEDYRKARDAYRADDAHLSSVFMGDLRECFEETLGHSLTDEQWAAVSRQAREDSHAGGLAEVLSIAMNLVDLIAPFKE